MDRRRLHSQQVFSGPAVTKQKIYVGFYLVFGSRVQFEFTHSHRVRKQTHFAVQKNRPNESYVQQNIQRFLENEIAEKGCAQNVGNDVILMGGCILRCPGVRHAERS
jgi:hypothetical protein